MKRKDAIRQLLKEKKLGAALSRMDYVVSTFHQADNQLIMLMARYNRLRLDAENKVVLAEEVLTNFHRILQTAMAYWEEYCQTMPNPMLEEIVQPQDEGEEPLLR